MKNCKIVIFALVAALAAVSCGRTAGIDAHVDGLSSSDVVIRQLNVNRYDVLDTVKTDDKGNLSYKVKLEKGNPEFIYLYYNDRKLASLLLEEGDRVKVNADTLGNYSVENSPESEKLAALESRYAGFSASVDALSEELLEAGLESPQAKEINAKITALYTAYYRECVKYVMENSHSLTVVPVFYQTVANSFYVFSQDTDAIIFKNICDSLKTVYPDSKYVKALSSEADSRSAALEFNLRLRNAQETGYLDIELPDINGNKVKLSSLDSKVILLHFWTSSNAEQKMFNLDVLKGIYKDYHSKGLDIYQVAIDADKPSWSRTVAAQGLEWVNVCDGLGTNSPVLGMYNVTSLPVTYVIADGDMRQERISDEASLRKLLNQLLK